MIPNLTLIIGVYVFVRLATIALKQFPQIKLHRVTRIVTAACAAIAMALASICTLDTIGVGLSVGSTIDAKRPSPYPLR